MEAFRLQRARSRTKKLSTAKTVLQVPNSDSNQTFTLISNVAGVSSEHRQSQGCVGRGRYRLWRAVRRTVPLLLVCAYLSVGALIFFHVEHEQQLYRQHGQTTQSHVEDALAKSQKKLLGIADINKTDTSTVNKIEKELNRLVTSLHCAKDDDIRNWTYTGSLFYCTSLITTIGYGSISPVTSAGKLGSVLYSLVGIPLTLFVLADTGQLLRVFVWKCYALIRLKLVGRVCGLGEFDPSVNHGEFPMWVAVGLTVTWLAGCTTTFAWYEQTTAIDALWFSFQSFATIGLGDIVPSPKYMIMAFLQILVGLILMSMCWDLLQMKVKNLVDLLQRRIQNALVSDMELKSNHKLDNTVDTENVVNIYNDDYTANVETLINQAGRGAPMLSVFVNDSVIDALTKELEAKINQRHQFTQTECATDFRESQSRDNAPIHDDIENDNDTTNITMIT